MLASVVLLKARGSVSRCCSTATASAPATPNTAPEAPTATASCAEKLRLKPLPISAEPR